MGVTLFRWMLESRNLFFFFFLMESHVSRQRTGVDQSLCHQQSPNTPGRGTGPRAQAAPPAFRALPSPSGVGPPRPSPVHVSPASCLHQ